MKKFLVTLGVLMLLFSLTAYAESNFDPLIKNAGSAIMEKYNTGQYGINLTAAILLNSQMNLKK